MKISVNWLKDFVVISPPLERIAERLTMAGLEVKRVESLASSKDHFYEIEITSNRPDWLSHLGVAREIAAVENLSLKSLYSDSKVNRPMPSGWKVTLREAEGCPFYTGVYIEGISKTETPDFIRDRLATCGMRSISLIVDVTNYVLLETGQPLHAFDADLLAGQEVIIRRAKEGEKFAAINGDEILLSANELLIADAEKGVALAGIMGGKNTEVHERTRNIFLESAFFNPRWVRQSSLRTGTKSESSYRFERRVDPQMVECARERAVELIKQYAKPRFISGVLRAGQAPETSKNRVHISGAEITKALGVAIKPSQVASIWTRLGLDVKNDSQDSWSVGIPSFRSDLTRPIDLIEEVARIYGYEHIPETLPSGYPLTVCGNEMYKLITETQSHLSHQGLCEAVTFSLVSDRGFEWDPKETVRIRNPHHQELQVMRPTLLPSLLDVVERNVRHGMRSVAVFEIANTYHQIRTGHPPDEEKVLAMILYGPWKTKSWLDPQREACYYDLKGILKGYLEGLGISKAQFQKRFSYRGLSEQTAESVLILNKESGYLGQVHPLLMKEWGLEGSAYFAEISLKKIVPHILWVKPFRELPKYPAVERDLSIMVPEDVKAGIVEKALYDEGGVTLIKVELFDLFRGGRIPQGYKNLAYRLTYQSSEKTLLSEDVQSLHTQIAEKIQKKFQAAFQH